MWQNKTCRADFAGFWDGSPIRAAAEFPVSLPAVPIDNGASVRLILPPFLALAALGFLASLAAHLLALAGSLPPGGMSVFGLHVGIFVLWIPVVLLVLRVNWVQPSRGAWRNMLSGCPTWMRYVTAGLFVYAIVNFFVAFTGVDAQRSGDDALSPAVLRGFSGHWMLFYAIAFAVLYSVYRKPELLRRTRCANGHSVAADDRFCATCGVAIPDPRART
jgi:hypothetical protein